MNVRFLQMTPRARCANGMAMGSFGRCLRSDLWLIIDASVFYLVAGGNRAEIASFWNVVTKDVLEN